MSNPYIEQLLKMSEHIAETEQKVIRQMTEENYTEAARTAAELKELADSFNVLKTEIQKDAISIEDVEMLRSITPHRKSVQNMLDSEVAKTTKFEKLLGEEMGAKSPYEMRNSDNAWRNDETKTIPVIELQKREIPKNLSEIRKDKNIERDTFVNRDTGIKVQFSRHSLNEIVAKAIPDAKRDIPTEARVSALYQMRDIIENAVCFDSQIAEYDPVTSKNKSPNSLFIHRMYGAVKYDNDLFLVNLAVEEMYTRMVDNKMESTLNRIYSLRDIKIAPVELLGLKAYADLQNASEDAPSSANLSIPQLYEIVKTYDEKFYENPTAIGRSDRLKEIELHDKLRKAIEELQQCETLLNEHINEKENDIMEHDNATVEPAEFDEGYALEKYEDYKYRWTKAHISNEVMASTQSAYKNDPYAEGMTFREYVEEFGYTDGSCYASFEEFVQNEFPIYALAEDIEQAMYERGEYDAPESDRLSWIGLDAPVDAVLLSLENEPISLMEYFRSELAVIAPEDEWAEKAEKCIEKIQTLCNVEERERQPEQDSQKSKNHAPSKKSNSLDER